MCGCPSLLFLYVEKFIVQLKNEIVSVLFFLVTTDLTCLSLGIEYLKLDPYISKVFLSINIITESSNQALQN